MEFKFDEITAIVIPFVVFSCVLVLHLRYFLKGAHFGSDRAPLNFFMKMREGWVDNNHLSGQAAVNTTRDYIRVITFLAGNAILVATVLAGFAVQVETDTFHKKLLIVKLGACVAAFIIIFICLLMCARFIVHFSFLINVKEMNGKLVTKRSMYTLFHRGHAYFTLALRLYYIVVPLFAWIFSEWCLLVIAPAYIYLCVKSEDTAWLQREISDQLSSDEKDTGLGSEAFVSGTSAMQASSPSSLHNRSMTFSSGDGNGKSLGLNLLHSGPEV